MKSFARPSTAAFLTTLFLLSLTTGKALRPAPDTATSSTEPSPVFMEGKSPATSKEEAKEDVLGETYATGSSLPDCSHACGPCFPCKRVMVSFKCSVAESCPIVYRCMCRGRYYHTPSN